MPSFAELLKLHSLDIIKVEYEKQKSQLDIESKLGYICQSITEDGDLQKLQWIKDTFGNFSKHLPRVVRQACLCDHVHIVVWIYSFSDIKKYKLWRSRNFLSNLVVRSNWAEYKIYSKEVILTEIMTC